MPKQTNQVNAPDGGLVTPEKPAQPKDTKSVTVDDMLWAITELPVHAQIYKGKNYWTVSKKLPYGGYIKNRNRRLAECLVEFVDEWEKYAAVNDLRLDDPETKEEL